MDILWPSATGLTPKIQHSLPKVVTSTQDDEVVSLRQQVESLQAKLDKDREFYDTALETRTNQLEQKEQEVEKLTEQKDKLAKEKDELQEQLNQFEFEKEMTIKETLKKGVNKSEAVSTSKLQLENTSLIREIEELNKTMSM